MSGHHRQGITSSTLTDLVDRARRLIVPGERRLLGIAGPPGVGKSTLAAALCGELGADAVRVPLDGFHLANEVLADLGLTSRKGAPETFDASGFRALLIRLRAQDEPIVYAPEFHREIEQAVSGALPIPRDAPLIVVEGNYLLLNSGPWQGIRDLLDDVWYLTLADDTRLDRLIHRHQLHGRSAVDAKAWTFGNDERNAAVVEASAIRADLVVSLSPNASGEASSGNPEES
ncbi:nucleoside/nucleotide kinase family protein [Leekyejoonella antrihumi]|uniref:Nucleoside/nucleotide kinase family protein n=1 Tax=Leekyejoonella antrihumi TaxID=1660198 RepID=A0A563DYZ9_9MICO|nr:nucleoside/nucleotide kinase family protein [Leekyejoonella antrihumi]TWP35425.1 nucleoside/nucleotide kinase family protein [Leekyejoonella antrihumi]